MKKKIVMLLGHDLLIPQIDPRVYKEAKTALNNGFEPVFVCLSNLSKKTEIFEGIKVRRIPDQANLKSFQNQSIVLSSPKLFLANLRNVITMVKTISQERPDIIHANDADTLLSGTLAKIANLFRPRLVYDSHEIATEIIDFRRFRPIIFLVEWSCSFFVDGFITVSSPILKFILHRFPRLNKKTLVLVNSPLLDKKINLKPKHVGKIVKVVYQGNLTGGRLTTIEQTAESLLKEAKTEWSLTLIVNKDKIPPSSSLFTNKNIKFKNLIANRKLFLKTLNQFDLGIVPGSKNCLNNYYSLPNKLFDYMEVGVAVLAPKLPTIAKIVSETECGFIFDLEDEKSFQETLSFALNNKGTIQDKKTNGKMWIEKKYNWANQEQKLVRFYRSI